MYINWETRSYFDFNSLDPFATHGIPLPTYGNYGGPNYSAGEVGGQITLTSADPPPVDPLDALFYQHDFVYQSSTEPLDRAAADVQRAPAHAGGRPGAGRRRGPAGAARPS